MADTGAEIAARLEALRREYATQLPQRLAAIEDCWAQLTGSHPVPAMLTELHRLAHNLAGSGKTFGFDAVSDSARSLEQYARSTLAQAGPLTSVRLSELGQAMLGLRQVFGKLAEAGRADKGLQVTAASGQKPACNRLLFLIEDDPDFARQLSLQLGHYGYEVRIFSRLAGIEAEIVRMRPAAIISDIYLPGGDDVEASGRLLRQSSAPSFLFISSRTDLETRLKAVRAGASAFFGKPVEIGALVERLDGLIAPLAEEPYRVLIVDDSEMLAEYYSLVLRASGMVVQSVQDPRRALLVLEDMRPDIILMDLYMEYCTGLELAAVIRQQPEYLGIPIVFLSMETDLDKQLTALGLGGDDFLTKPIDAGHLQRAVRSRIDRARALRSLMLRDSLTGLLNHTASTHCLEAELARARRDGHPVALVIIDIDHFKSVNDTYGHPAGDRVIKNLSRLLRQRLRGSDCIGRLGGEEFIVVLPNATAIRAGQILDQVRDSFAVLPHDAGGHTFTATFSCGVVEAAPGSTVADLMAAADQALYSAKHGGRNRVQVAGAPPQ